MSFKVQKRLCATCIYRPDSALDLRRLEDAVRDKHIGFCGYRACHHAPNSSRICCRGFWNAHKDEFAAGQIAQRLGLVQFVDVDVLKVGRAPEAKPAAPKRRRARARRIQLKR
jgi:hypothetical protein